MKAINCKLCGKFILHTQSMLCTDCLAKERLQVETVKRYLAEHPRASFMEVVYSTGVSYQTVRSLMS